MMIAVLILHSPFSILHSNAQDFTLLNTIPFNQSASFTTDNLGNAYVLTENILLQFDRNGLPKANFSDRSAGRLQMVDASNPLKLLLFYPDFAQLRILNSKLALESVIELRTIGILQPLAAGQSTKEGFWIYDMQDAQLKKINQQIQLQHESGNLNQLLGYSLDPDLILESNGNVFLNNPSTGILVFDQYGSYLKTLPFKNLASFQVIENDVLFVEQGQLKKYNLKTQELTEVLIPSTDAGQVPPESLINARIEQSQLYLLTNASLRFYSY